MSSSTSASIHEELARHFERVVAVEPEGEHFRVTLPGSTFDGHLVNVYLRRLSGRYWEVHDASSTAADLFCQGVHISPRRRQKMRHIARRLGIELDESDAFKAVCREDELAFHVWRVRDAAALASTLLLEHRLAMARAELRQHIRQALHAVAERGFQVRERAALTGKLTQHRVDFEVRPERDSLAATIQVLSPSGDQWQRARAYAFMVVDLDGRYRHVAVLDEPNLWTTKASDLVRRVVARVVEAEEPEPAAAT